MAERIDTLFFRRARETRALTRVSLECISPNPAQPRHTFSENAIIELAGSIRRYGLLSPLVVRRTSPERCELIAGERRLRALLLLGETETDALVVNASDQESALIALVENLQREELGFFEEAEAYQALIEQHGISREQLAARLSRSPSAVANRLRLLKLSPAVRAGIAAAGLTERHARALLRLPDEAGRLEALDRAARENMTVKALEQLIEKMLHAPRESKQTVRGVYRDHRIFVNAVLDAVRTLQTSGVGVTSRVTDRADSVEIIVVIPHAAPPSLRR